MTLVYWESEYVSSLLLFRYRRSCFVFGSIVKRRYSVNEGRFLRCPLLSSIFNLVFVKGSNRSFIELDGKINRRHSSGHDSQDLLRVLDHSTNMFYELGYQ